MDSEAYVRELEREFPRLRILDKSESALCRIIDVALRVLTLGGQSAFQTRYVTTLGQRIYVPTDWHSRPDLERTITLRHEAVHLRQFARHGFAKMAFLYLLPFFPMGLAYGRARLEWEAYAETLAAIAELKGMAAARDRGLHLGIVRQFSGPAYGFMWPFPKQVQRWIDETLDALESERPPAARSV